MHVFGKKSPSLKLTRQLYFANAMIALAFLFLVAIIVATYIAVEKRSIGVVKSDMGRVVNNSAVVREITTLFGQIDVLNRAFYGNDEYLRVEGENLLRHIDEIAGLSANSPLQEPLQSLADQLDSFLARCTGVNASLQARNAIDREIDQQLGKLENLISILLIDATLSDGDTAYITQLLTLVLGYNESFLVIGKLYAEYERSAHDVASRASKLRVLDAIDDLSLRLQTITASTPEVSQQGRNIKASVTRYRDAVSKVFEEIEQLNAERSAMSRTRASLLAALKDIDSQIAAESQLVAESVDSIFLFSTTAVLVFSLAIVSGIFLLTMNLARFKIIHPIQSILSGIDSFSRGNLDNRIEPNRIEEWNSIADALNKMAADLSASRAELQFANSELENRVKLRTSELAKTVGQLQREVGERERISIELENKNSELERFAYTISHDLKSPLVTIQGFVGLLRQDIADLQMERVAGDLDKISDAADTMKMLLDDLLELSRVGQVVGELIECRLSDIAHQAVESLTGKIDECGIELEIDDMPSAQVDTTRMREVYQNLIENAIKYMGEQQAPRIRVGAQVKDEMLHCFVSDNGIGIEDKFQEQIFGLFERLSSDNSGTGIGLALVKRIIEVHGGKVWVESEGLGKGTTLWFTLPCSAAQSTGKFRESVIAAN
jgi:signal transduction histidine kinase